MNEYYLHLASVTVGEKGWEKVDEFTYNNWANAIAGDNQPRYDGKRFCKVEGRIYLHLDQATESELSIVTRILNVRPDTTSTVAGGFFKTPEYVKFIKGKNKSVVLHEMDGGTYRLNAA